VSIYLKAIFPFKANEIAFMNSVVFGTSAKRVTPKNFSSIPEPSKITSTMPTRISGANYSIIKNRINGEAVYIPAIKANSAVHMSSTLALVIRLHEGASCPL